jgi:hypothetical protein
MVDVSAMILIGTGTATDAGNQYYTPASAVQTLIVK